jgi:hypothetical protein
VKQVPFDFSKPLPPAPEPTPPARDLTKGEALRDVALDRMAKAQPGWIALVEQLICAMPAHQEFTTDELWHALGKLTPPEPRAMGSAMQAAKRRGLIVATGNYRQSERPDCHARPVLVWRRKP